MSFFGITAFGPENFIKSSLVNSNGFTLYSNEEFQVGFGKITKLRNTPGKLFIRDVKQFLSLTFGFTPLDDEIQTFISSSGKFDENEFLELEEILQILSLIREKADLSATNSKIYSSYGKYYDDTYKHRRKEPNPNEVFKSPVTYTQNYGFYKFTDRDLNDVRYPKKLSDETKYADSILKTGKHLMK